MKQDTLIAPAATPPIGTALSEATHFYASFCKMMVV